MWVRVTSQGKQQAKQGYVPLKNNKCGVSVLTKHWSLWQQLNSISTNVSTGRASRFFYLITSPTDARLGVCMKNCKPSPVNASMSKTKTKDQVQALHSVSMNTNVSDSLLCPGSDTLHMMNAEITHT